MGSEMCIRDSTRRSAEIGTKYFSYNASPIMRLLLLYILAFNVPNQSLASDDLGVYLTSDYSLKEAFDPNELRTLANDPSGDERRLMLLILRATIEKDASFQSLLEMPRLRKSTSVSLALSAYDYTMNQSEPALDRILAQLATEDVGADVDTIVTLQVVNEWDRTIRAFRKHFIHTDGAGGSCKSGFMATRSYLYPKKYLAMRESIEAPIEWSSPLLPEKQKAEQE